RFSRDWSSDVCSSDLMTSNFISRHSIYRGGFTLLSSSNSNYPVFNNINLFSLVATQRKSISNILEELSTALSHELDPHKEAFRRSEERRVGKECRPVW